MMNRADHSMRRRLFAAGAVAVSLAIAGLALYEAGQDFVTGPIEPQETGKAPTPPATAPTAIDEFRFSFLDQPRRVPDLHFIDGEGRRLSLQDFRGKPLLLNIWATWCVPCRKEMPSLDRLQAKLGASQLLVLPLSIDRQGVTIVKKFYADLGLTSLGIYVEPTGTAATEINTIGVPTTLLIDRDGREIARKVGPATWDSPAIIGLILKHLELADGVRKGNP